MKRIIAVVLSLLLMLAALLSVFLVLGGDVTDVIDLNSDLEMPTELVVDQERFLAKFQVWVTLSNFQVEVKERKLDNGISINQHEFTIDCSCLGQSDLAASYMWVVETYEDNKLIDKMRYKISAGRLNGIVRENPLSLIGRPSFQANDSSRYRFFSYFEQVRRNPAPHSQFVSGLIEPNGKRSSSVPVALKPAMEHQVILELSNPVFDFSNGQQHLFECDYTVVDDNMIPKGGADEAHEYTFMINIVGDLGESMQLRSEFSFEEKQGSFHLSNDVLLLPQSLKNYLKWRPLTIYISSGGSSLALRGKPSSKLFPQKVVSNLLVIE